MPRSLTFPPAGRKGAREEDEATEEVAVDFERQKQEMRALFGDRADEVLAAEARMDLALTRICADNGPALWPCIPLNPKFH